MVTLRPPGWLRRGTLLAWLAGVALVAVAIGVFTANGSPEALKSAKSFSLGALGHPGTDIALSQYAGRPVIINFFASWCTPCQQETPMLARFYRSHHARVLVIGIDANDQSGAAVKFVRAHGVGYPVAFDPSASVTVSYGVAALPQTFFLNAKHQIVRHVVGKLTLPELTSWAASLPQPNGAS